MAADEKGALKILHQEHIDFAVIDVRLHESPDDESGLELANAIYALAPYIQTVILSGSTKPGHIISAFKDFGVVDYIVKTAGWEDRLLEEIKEHVKNLSPKKGETPIGKSLFISYSHQDQKWLDKFTPHLKVLADNKQLTIWDDRKIKSGAKWRDEIQKALSTAKVALLLVTPDFLASEFIKNVELPELFSAAEKRGLTILWVAVMPSMYEVTYISEFQSTNEPSKPLANLTPAKARQEIVQICKKVLEATK
jgi:YesN/AraC family two-component response regulator